MPYESESDRALVARTVSGDRAAFETLHRRYYQAIYRLAYMQASNHADAEDIASETFCRAYHRIGHFGFRQCDSLYPWLHRIAVNLCVDLCRDRIAHSAVSLDTPTIEGARSILESLESVEPRPEEILERMEVQELVRQAISALVEDQRDAVVYRFLADMTINEIAGAMQRSEGAVKSLLHRAMIALRKEVLDRLGKIGRTDVIGRSEEKTDVRGDSVRVHRRIE